MWIPAIMFMLIGLYCVILFIFHLYGNISSYKKSGDKWFITDMLPINLIFLIIGLPMFALGIYILL